MNSADMNEVFGRLGKENKPFLDERLRRVWIEDDSESALGTAGCYEGPAKLNHPLEEGK